MGEALKVGVGAEDAGRVQLRDNNQPDVAKKLTLVKFRLANILVFRLVRVAWWPSGTSHQSGLPSAAGPGVPLVAEFALGSRSWLKHSAALVLRHSLCWGWVSEGAGEGDGI